MTDNFFFFFFSSRRRHTRSLCDWSSDVCSSDLLPAPRVNFVRVVINGESWGVFLNAQQFNKRSEERRVGKECRSRWSTYPSKKNKRINSRWRASSSSVENLMVARDSSAAA